VFDTGFEQAPKTRRRMSGKQARRDIGFFIARSSIVTTGTKRATPSHRFRII
jgi:hypothetical protein